MGLFESEDYREYLRNWIRSLPKNGRGEINKIAGLLNVNPTVISQTLSGVRDFSAEQTLELTDYMGLSELEADYFSTLVQIERASTKKLKDRLRSKVLKLRAESLQVAKRIQEHRSLSETDRARFYSNSIYAKVRLYCDVNGGQTLEAIRERFHLSRAKTQEILSFLISTRLCVEVAGVYRMGPQTTHLEATSPFITKHHTNWRLEAIHRAQDLPAEELMFSAPMSLSKEDFSRLRESMVTYIKTVIGEVKDSKSEDVACFNLDFIWLEK